MADETKKNGNREPGRTRHIEDQPVALPGIRRYQPFTNLEDRMPTKNINRAAMLGVAAAVGAAVLKPIGHGMPQTSYCYECRACYATQHRCPGRISEQAELTVASRVLDYRRFIEKGGMNCVRCGNCQPFCAAHLDLPKIYGTMQKKTIAAMKAGHVPADVVADALAKGKFGRDFLAETVEFMRKLKKETGRPIPEPKIDLISI